MKKNIITLAIVLSSSIFKPAAAQVQFSINIVSQPVWGPVGYDHVEYYYIPDIDAFYYVPKRQYIYTNRGQWIFSPSLPPRYSNYNLYSGYKVVINEPKPYTNIAIYRTKYNGYKGNHSQEIIRNSRDSRYFPNKGHPEYNTWKKNNIQKNKDKHGKINNSSNHRKNKN